MCPCDDQGSVARSPLAATGHLPQKVIAVCVAYFAVLTELWFYTSTKIMVGLRGRTDLSANSQQGSRLWLYWSTIHWELWSILKLLKIELVKILIFDQLNRHRSWSLRMDTYNPRYICAWLTLFSLRSYTIHTKMVLYICMCKCILSTYILHSMQFSIIENVA